VPLLPGQTETLLWEFVPESGDIGPWNFDVTVHDQAAGLSLELECAEDNNEDSVGAVPGGAVAEFASIGPEATRSAMIEWR